MNKLMTLSFMTILIGVFLLGFILPDESISFSERRPLVDKPEFNGDNILSGEYFEDLEKYFLDHMPLRERFKSIKANLELHVFKKSDINDMYVYEDHLIKIEYPYNPVMGQRFVDYVETIKDMYLKENKVYLSIIPDKNYFGPDHALKLDYDQMIEDIKAGEYTYLDLFSVLELEDYYLTDPHWKQENLDKVVDLLSKKMNFEMSTLDYEIQSFDRFFGAYAGQSSISSNSESLKYLYHESMKDIEVFNYELNDYINLYNQDALEGIDPYDIFVGGASPLIEIINEDASSDKELIIFRDSFSSALAPLLTQSYSKITLVDTRYINHDYLDNFIEFNDQDVLFLYSTLVVNNSVMLK